MYTKLQKFGSRCTGTLSNFQSRISKDANTPPANIYFFLPCNKPDLSDEHAGHSKRVNEKTESYNSEPPVCQKVPETPVFVYSSEKRIRKYLSLMKWRRIRCTNQYRHVIDVIRLLYCRLVCSQHQVPSKSRRIKRPSGHDCSHLQN